MKIHKKSIYMAMSALALVVIFFVRASLVSVDAPEIEEQIYQSQDAASSLAFDSKKKAEQIVELAERTIQYLHEHSLVELCNAIAHGEEFMRGDESAFIMDMKGRFLVNGQKTNMIWRDYSNYRDALGSLIAQQMIEQVQRGGGWVSYEWRGATKVTYVQKVTKNDVDYIVGAGYYPHSKGDTVVTLVKGAVAIVNKDLQEDRPMEQAFSTISYPMGRFISGDLYLYAVRFDGLQVAHENSQYIRQNVIDYKDTAGKFVNRDIIKALSEKPLGEGVWFEYQSRSTKKRAYAERVTDKAGVNYFIACGYYPEVTREQAVDLVRRGYQYMKSHGLSQAIKSFSTNRGNQFVFGDLSLVVFDEAGILIADLNESLIGQDMIKEKDEDGRYYIQEIIKKAKAGGGWIDFKLNKSFKSLYVEYVELGVDHFIVCAGLYPVSKRDTTQLLAKSALSYIETNPLGQAFEQFVDVKSNFIRGDLYIYVYDLQGVCYAHGENYSHLWKNRFNVKDDNGKEYVRMIIESTASGPAQVSYVKDGATAVAFAERIEKDGLVLVVGSKFYQ